MGDSVPGRPKTLPLSLSLSLSRIRAQIPREEAKEAGDARADVVEDAQEEASEKVVRPVVWKWLHRADVGWAAALVFAVLFLAGLLAPDSGENGTLPAQQLQALKESGTDLVEKPFSGVGEYEGIEGSVVWSDQRQEGYMTLTNLPENDPSKKQYQLWIVDSERDKIPTAVVTYNGKHTYSIKMFP